MHSKLPPIWVFSYLLRSVDENIGQQKNTFFQYPNQLFTNLGPEWCAEHDDIFGFSNFVLDFPLLYVEIRQTTLFRHIAIVSTPFIYSHLHKCHITNVYHKWNFASKQKFLEIHCLHRKKTPLHLEHGYYHAVNMGSDYAGIFFLGHGVEDSFLHMEA